MKIVWCLGSEFSSDRNFGYLAELLNDTIPIASMYGIFTRMYHKNQLYQCLGIYIYTIRNTWHGYYPVIWRLPYLIIIRIPNKFKHFRWFLPQNSKLNGSCFTLFPAHLTWKSRSGFSWSWNKMKNSCAKARRPERWRRIWFRRSLPRIWVGVFFHVVQWFPPNAEVWTQTTRQ